MRKVISLIGFGEIGSQIAQIIGIKNLDITIKVLDLQLEITAGKVLDITQGFTACNSNCRLIFTSDISEMSDTDVFIITAGLKRDPMLHKTREDLYFANKNIISNIAQSIKKYAPNSFSIIITNPLDAMLYQFVKNGNFNPKQAIGMAGTLDCARFQGILSERFNISEQMIEVAIFGTHNDEMTLATRDTKINNVSLDDMIELGHISKTEVADLFSKSAKMGAEINAKMGKSAYFAPATCAVKLAESVLFDKKEKHIASIINQNYINNFNCACGLPIVLGKHGVENVLDINLNTEESLKLHESLSKLEQLICQ